MYKVPPPYTTKFCVCVHVVWTFDLVDGPKPKAIYNGKVKSKLAALQNSSVMWQSEIIGIEWIRSPHGVLEPLGL